MMTMIFQQLTNSVTRSVDSSLAWACWLLSFFLRFCSSHILPWRKKACLVDNIGVWGLLNLSSGGAQELKSSNKRYFFYLSLAKKIMLLLNNISNVIVQSKEQPRFFQDCTHMFLKLLNSLFRSFQRNVWEKPQFEYFQGDRKFPEYLLKTVNIHLTVDRWWRGFSGWFFVKYYFIIWIVHAFSQLLEKFCGLIFV